MTQKEFAQTISNLRKTRFFDNLSEIEITIVNSILNDVTMTSRNKAELLLLFIQYREDHLKAKIPFIKRIFKGLCRKIKAIFWCF